MKLKWILVITVATGLLSWGVPAEDNWVMSEGPIPEAGPETVLVRAIYLDVTPYMRGRISPQQNYTAGVSPGDLMVGEAIGQVVDSNADD